MAVSNLVYAFDPIVPAGTAIATPATFDLSFPQAVVDSIEVHVPPGPNGNLGFAFANADQPIIPFNAGQWIIADDDFFTWSLSGQITSGAWQLIAYNTGIYQHQVFIRFLCTSIGSASPVAPVALIAATDLSQPADATAATLLPDITVT